MVFIIDGIKYACASCIRGHRVKKCTHSNRPLIQIQKRGRQVSQCLQCRDLRKSSNKKPHSKCTCVSQSTMPHPVNGCLFSVCNCVACHLQDNEKSSKLYSTSPDSSSSYHSIAPTHTLISPIYSTQTIDTTNITSNPLSPVSIDKFNTNYDFNGVYYTSSIFIKEDAELIDFLFNDLDKFLVPSPQLI